MTVKQINQHNEETQRNRQIVRDLWEKLDRKPTLDEMKAAIEAAG